MTGDASYDPRTGSVVATATATTPEEVGLAARRAAQVAPAVAATSPRRRRRWLHGVADALEAHREELVALGDAETALGSERLGGEITRAANQLRFYGDVAAEGSYLGVTLDPATATSPALARVNQPLGPVAVFGASNFPFAFGVLGNDTACALAAGCPVVVKAHPAHLGTSVRQVEIAYEALAAADAPADVLDVVVGHDAGVRLVQAPEVSAVGFTGSQAGGLALWRLANDRDEVIPVYAEMGTVNPVVVTRAAAADIASVATGFVGSFTQGHGQFCTKPGLFLAPTGSGAARAVATALRAAAPRPVMLTRAIADSVVTGISEMEAAGAEVVTRLDPPGSTGWVAPAAVLSAGADALERGSRLLEECFGAVVVVVEYDSDEQLASVLSTLQPSLAASLVTGTEDDPQAAALVEVLSRKVGRVAVNDWPTGVAVAWAQQHGGPWPATSAPGATSVGAHGLARFVRPVAYQSSYDAWLPPAARAANPWRVPRRVAGEARAGGSA
ncbi:aldehyde dehydrogenase family protein [Nocardioides sp. NPDC092400]|uniref:aldehyde dehydrogenase family protein n=1 Tax=Nocardioides sp. NPDC092400 TaxID=3155196 RepID=UPI003449E8CB